MKVVGSGSHYQAARDGWRRPASYADILTQVTAARVAGLTGQTLGLSWPWDPEDDADDPETPASREEIAEANQALQARSAYQGPWPDDPPTQPDDE